VIPSAGAVSPSLSLAVAINHDCGGAGFGDGEIEALLAILRDVEGNQKWPAGNLWDEI
jgi:hypothetical protein